MGLMRKGRDGFPKYLTSYLRDDGREYFVYKHPSLPKPKPFGYDQDKAIAAAKQLNTLLGRDLVSLALDSSGGSVGGYIEYWRDHILPARKVNGLPLSQDTILEYNRISSLYSSRWGKKDFRKITQADVASALSERPTPEAFNKHRALLVQIWKHAISDGKTKDNLPELIIKRDKSRRRRKRLEIGWYDEILKCASVPIQNAMQLSLNCLQRRTDIQRWAFDWSRDGLVYIAQSKSRKYGPSAFIAIPENFPFIRSDYKTLGDFIKYCRDTTLSPYVIHQRARIKSHEREHWTQLRRQEISKGFAKARDLSGVCNHLDPEERPSFHEVISTGEYLMKEAGWDESIIQSLRGHSTREMTLFYLDGHDYKRVEVPN